MARKICVIGAGVSGLTCIKTCLEEELQVVCYEKTDNIGGLWRFRDDDLYGIASVMKSTIINSSKELSSYSDFPPPDNFANFMHNVYIVKYLEMYAEKFKLIPCIRFEHEVLKVEKVTNFAVTGNWKITVKDKNGSVSEDVFDAVLVCSGHHVYPHIPDFYGLNNFQGSVIHTHSLKGPKGLEDKNVLIIGIGNSGGDAAVELSRFAKQVYLSTRRGTWVQGRVAEQGHPIDVLYNTRCIKLGMRLLPWNIINSIMEFRANRKFDHERYCLKPEHRILAQHVMINDDLANRILSGTVIIKGDVDHFTENGVAFQDAPNQTFDVDVVILATGYDIKFPFIEDSVVPVEKNNVTLYKYAFPPHLKHPTLAVIGLIQPLGSITPISEMQARWAVRVFKGLCKLPSKAAMMKDIEAKQNEMKKTFCPSQRHTIQVDYITFMDEIAELINVKPNLLKILFKDPPLFLACFFGPCVPYQYRLNGPNAWPEAPDAILSVRRRIRYPLSTKPMPKNTSMSSFTILLIFFFITSVLILLLYFRYVF